MSEIATLESLELHLSYAPGYRITRNQSKGSALESFFSEIRYTSFEENTETRASYPLYTGSKPNKNGAAAYKLTIR